MPIAHLIYSGNVNPLGCRHPAFELQVRTRSMSATLLAPTQNYFRFVRDWPEIRKNENFLHRFWMRL